MHRDFHRTQSAQEGRFLIIQQKSPSPSPSPSPSLFFPFLWIFVADFVMVQIPHTMSEIMIRYSHCI